MALALFDLSGLPVRVAPSVLEHGMVAVLVPVGLVSRLPRQAGGTCGCYLTADALHHPKSHDRGGTYPSDLTNRSRPSRLLIPALRLQGSSASSCCQASRLVDRQLGLEHGRASYISGGPTPTLRPHYQSRALLCSSCLPASVAGRVPDAPSRPCIYPLWYNRMSCFLRSQYIYPF